MVMKPADMVYDYVVFVIFILICVGVAVYNRFVGPKERSKKDYVFASGASVSMGAMMLSIARGTLGVKSFLGYPSELYYRGSAMWETLYGMVLAYPIVSFIFVPVYFNLGITSVYQYLDMRFKSRLVRMLASFTYVVRSLLNLGVTVFTPCVALKTLFQLPYYVSIVSITGISVVFSVLGGLKAAIQVDVLQGIVMIACSLAIIIKGYIDYQGSPDVFTLAYERGRLNFMNFDFTPTTRVSTFSALFGQLFMSLSIFGCQQSFVQRYCSMDSQKQVTKTLMLNIPVITVLFSLSWIVGIMIFGNYADCDPLTEGYINKIDEIVPFYVEHKLSLYYGFLGLFLASLFNGALSIAVSNINSLATVTWEDFIAQIPRFKTVSDQRQLYCIKSVGAIYGLIIIGIAFGVALFSGVIESSMLMTSATSGPLLGVFILAMLFPCANAKGASLGMIVGHAVTLWITFGGLALEKIPIVLLPLNTTGCTNDTFMTMGPPQPISQYAQTPAEFTNSTTDPDPLYIYNATAEDVEDILSIQKQPEGLFSDLYGISYMYYSLIGCGITVVLGIIISYIAGTTEEDVYDEKLLHPLALKVSKWFPGKPRVYLANKADPIEKHTPHIEETRISNGVNGIGRNNPHNLGENKVPA